MPFDIHNFSIYAPESLQQYTYKIFNRLNSSLDSEDLSQLYRRLNKEPDLTAYVVRALTGSDYIVESCCRDPKLLTQWLLNDASTSPLMPDNIIDSIATAVSKATTSAELNSLLRCLRRRFMAALYWRDLNGLADFSEVSTTMTVMAEAFTQQTLDFHYQALCEKHGVPIGKNSQQPQPMLVIGMGKLGGSELNVSSDIDLMFTFPEAGKTNHKARPIDNQQFFTLLGQQLIKTLSDITAEGFVFRVDMRLRPYGQSGVLVNNFASLEQYYQTQGRDWERFAAIKARVVAYSRMADHPCLAAAMGKMGKAEIAITTHLHQILQPFVYRKYIDFSTVESLRQLKAMIVQEVRRKGLEDDIKLGAGGIREIEFIAQSFQLIRGGKDTRLQERHLLTVLQRLCELNNLDEDIVDGLTEAYLFLRKTEHSIQAMQDAQTQKLPVDPPQQAILAWVMGYNNWDVFYQNLDIHRQFVSSTFQQLITEPCDKHVAYNTALPEWQAFWETPTIADLVDMEASSQKAIVEQVSQLKQSRNVISLSSIARQKLDLLMPQVFHVVSETSNGEQALIRILKWLETIVTRTSYLLLLLENPHIIKHLVNLFSASSWVAEMLTQIPALLDELLYPETLYSLPEKDELRDELRQRLLRIEPDDVEAYMETLRYFRLAHNLHVAACEIAGSLPLMKVSDYLTRTAEVILEQVLRLSWHILTSRYGYPEGTNNQSTGFLIVGYGKLGSIEMSYRSDLDLVFIYEASTKSMTNGDKSVDNQTFYTRLGQKIIHILNTRTLSGQLYEVDMRLRPSGNSGLLVSSLSAFERYQQQDAWAWEHQALVRARPVAGDEHLAPLFTELRKQVLQKPKDAASLKDDVLEMREKMKVHLGNNAKKPKKKTKIDQFHLKQDAGGIVDIEFMVQYAVLAWSQKQPAICEWTDNIRILESLQNSGFIAPEQANQLIDIYQAYRKYIHRLALQQKTLSVVEGDCFRDERQQVKALWEVIFRLTPNQ